MFSLKEEYLYFPIEYRQCLIKKKEKKKIIKIKRPLIEKKNVKNIIVLTFSDNYREPEEIILTQYKLLYLLLLLLLFVLNLHQLLHLIFL